MKDPRPAKIAAAVVRQIPPVVFTIIGEKWLRRLIRKEVENALASAGTHSTASPTSKNGDRVESVPAR